MTLHTGHAEWGGGGPANAGRYRSVCFRFLLVSQWVVTRFAATIRRMCHSTTAETTTTLQVMRITSLRAIKQSTVVLSCCHPAYGKFFLFWYSNELLQHGVLAFSLLEFALILLVASQAIAYWQRLPLSSRSAQLCASPQRQAFLSLLRLLNHSMSSMEKSLKLDFTKSLFFAQSLAMAGVWRALVVQVTASRR